MNENSAPEEKDEIKTTMDDINRCLFCNERSSTFEENLENMRKGFGFFIIEEESCFDKKGLVKFLAKLIFKYKECIFCGKIAKNIKRNILKIYYVIISN